jgi:hypothetical protein
MNSFIQTTVQENRYVWKGTSAAGKTLLLLLALCSFFSRFCLNVALFHVSLKCFIIMSETTLVRQVRYGLIKARINHAGDIAAMVLQVKSQRYSSKVYSNDIVEYRENLAHMVF